MSKPVMAILHWEADPDTALERYERAVAAWRETFGDLSSGPLHAIAGRSERGGLVVVNVFPTNGDHSRQSASRRPTSNTCRSADSVGRRASMARRSRLRCSGRVSPVILAHAARRA